MIYITDNSYFLEYKKYVFQTRLGVRNMYWLTGLLGIASALAPFVLNYASDTTALWTSIGVGLVLIVSAVFEAAAEDKEAWEYWVAGIVGLAAVAAPFVLNFGALTVAVWTLVIIGVIAIVTSGAKLFPGQIE